MPNHVTNVLTLHGEPEQIRAMLEAIQYDDLGIGSVDFNKIIPMPESLNIEAGSQTSTGLKAYQDFIEVYTLGGTIHQDDLENIPHKSEDAFLRQRSDIRPEEWELGKAAWNNIRLYGVPTWYGWRNHHWGTKWNSYGYGEAKVDYQDGDALNFLTAWSAPHPVMEKLAEMFPNVEIEHEWADEDIGHNCGRYRYQNGVRIEEWFPETEREAIDLGCELMGLEPLDYGLALNAAGTDYVNLEDDEYEKIELLGRCRYNSLPFEINRSREADETQRLKYRYLDLRNPAVKKNIILRCNVIAALRKAMMEHDFLEITTPILTASSPASTPASSTPCRRRRSSSSSC